MDYLNVSSVLFSGYSIILYKVSKPRPFYGYPVIFCNAGS